LSFHVAEKSLAPGLLPAPAMPCVPYIPDWLIVLSPFIHVRKVELVLCENENAGKMKVMNSSLAFIVRWI
jgi:hypothetical protein